MFNRLRSSALAFAFAGLLLAGCSADSVSGPDLSQEPEVIQAPIESGDVLFLEGGDGNGEGSSSQPGPWVDPNEDPCDDDPDGPECQPE